MRNLRLVLAPTSCTLIFSSRTRSRLELSNDRRPMPKNTGMISTQERIDGKTAKVRTLRDVDLFDVGPCTYPPYSDTKVSARSSGIVAPESTGLYIRRNDIMNGRAVTVMTAEEIRLRLRMASVIL